MEPPQQDFRTPTEESEATQGDQSPKRVLEEALEIQQKELVDRSESPRTTAELPEEAHQIVDDQKPPHSPVAEPQQSIDSLELSELIETEEQPLQELAEKGQDSSFGTVEKPLWPTAEPTNSTEQLPEQLKHEELDTSLAATELQEPERNLITETPVEIQPEEALKEETTVTETIQEPASEEQDSG